jgi:hypothetical protein
MDEIAKAENAFCMERRASRKRFKKEPIPVGFKIEKNIK